jgi:hypothetical protein
VNVWKWARGKEAGEDMNDAGGDGRVRKWEYGNL